MTDTPSNTFTDGPLGAIYLKTALPIIFVMSMNGLLSVADALFLGIYVGPDALAAVTLMFPIYMLIVALSTLVANGMSSILARSLGAGDTDQARATFAGAHGLAVGLGFCLILLFFLSGQSVALLAAGGVEALAQMGLVYLSITVLFSPLLFVLSVNSDALRNEGRVGFMAAMSLLVSISNIGFNFVLIVLLDMGVAGSAYGTAAAQALAFAIIVSFRFFGDTTLRPATLLSHSLYAKWGRILALGAPQSLSFIGLALGSAAIITALQWVGRPGYADTVTAYGIITRVITFAFLPLLGLSFAMQTITGNNYGAGLWKRSDTSLRTALWVSLVYCCVIEVVVMSTPSRIASAFVDDAAVIAEVARILPIMTCVFFLIGPLMMIATYFQAIGSAGKAAFLGLTKPYAFAIPLTFLLPVWFGEAGIWYAGPVAEVLMLALTAIVLWYASKGSKLKWGIFHTEEGAVQ
ncbi:putative efflux protein, MATE family [Aliiroseovarius halocynthiae]|uniref:Multidrug export protein MepA n=1 Tax=Aliiroseovarius halocynthiae TaxID=985055 RepID=A0A545SVN7_9RHOB|nr:MATE family efflux transporter [Aliiroseovarius halocynthiae]TQV69032.1 MATE family efflux transporter [Aliiroseovarius halocynthiae]SMR71783.1 putative efflux protein, MATE family [Aliiroseovarius halocynthiae]